MRGPSADNDPRITPVEFVFEHSSVEDSASCPVAIIGLLNTDTSCRALEHV